MNRREIAFSLAAAMAVTAVIPGTAQAAADLNLRKKVIGLAGIMNVTETESTVTRGEFASMLVNSTAYKSTVAQNANTSVFADVPKTHQHAAQIRIAVDQGWMSGYLGGVFKPDEPVTLQDAIKGILALLGYTNSDFTGDQTGARLSKYYYLELNDEINKEPLEILAGADCINLFYNLLKTETKSGGAYCKSLGYDVTAGGEINPLTIADNGMKGPKIVTKSHLLSDYVPFEVSTANLFLNGEATTAARIKDVMQSDGYVVIYYNTAAKTIWAYSESGSQVDRRVVRGEISAIYYSSTDVMTPSAVVLDDDGTQYLLKDSNVQFAFSIYGTLKVGDDVALICQVTENTNGDQTYTVADYIED